MVAMAWCSTSMSCRDPVGTKKNESDVTGTLDLDHLAGQGRERGAAVVIEWTGLETVIGIADATERDDLTTHKCEFFILYSHPNSMLCRVASKAVL